MTADEYVKDPCMASSLPFWKAESLSVPAHITVLRDDEFSKAKCKGKSEPYFKMKHDLKNIGPVNIPDGFEIVGCCVSEYARHINECYLQEHVSGEELFSYLKHPTYDPELWLALADKKSGRIVATGIAGSDARIGEGILDWIQVSPGLRRMGLGSFTVRELLRRLRGKAEFVTVSGRMNSPSNPMAMYASCGFSAPVIWHVITD